MLASYSTSDFHKFPQIQGRIHCPAGNYSAVKEIPKNCTFSSFCEIGAGTIIGQRCYFGAYTVIGDNTSIGSNCKFGDYTKIGSGVKVQEQTVFGNYCEFKDKVALASTCTIGNKCTIGDDFTMGAEAHIGFINSFGARAKIGERPLIAGYASFEEGSRVDGCVLKISKPQYLTLEGAGDVYRKLTFYNGVKGIMVRAGCFYGTLNEFRDKVLEDCAQDSLKAKQYLTFANVAALTFDRPKLVKAAHARLVPSESITPA